MNNDLKSRTVTIANGATDSSIIRTGGVLFPMALVMPASFTGATVKILCSMADAQGAEPAIGTFKPAYDSLAGTDVSFAVAAGKHVDLHHQVRANWVAIQSNSAEGAARSIDVILKAVD